MHWIRVTPETMPPEHTPILVTVNGMKMTVCAEYDGYGNFHVLDTEDNSLWADVYSLHRVTHWMPTPPPAED